MRPIKTCVICVFNIMFTYTWNIIWITHRFWEKAISYFPRKNRWTFSLIIWNFLNNWCRCYAWLRSTNRSWFDWPCFVISVKQGALSSRTFIVWFIQLHTCLKFCLRNHCLLEVFEIYRKALLQNAQALQFFA